MSVTSSTNTARKEHIVHHKASSADDAAKKTIGDAALERLTLTTQPSTGSALDRIKAADITSLPLNETETSKAASLPGRIASWIANTRVSIWATANVLKQTRFWMLLGAPSYATRSKIYASLDELTGSMHLSKTLHALSPPLAELIKDQLVSLELYQGISEFLKEEQWTLHTFIDVLLPAIFNNIALHIRSKEEASHVKDPLPVNLDSILSFLFGLVQKHAEEIKASYETIEKLTDPLKKERKLVKLFTPFTEEFLSIALPGGVKELPLTHIPVVSHFFWNTLRSNVFPKMFIKLYRQFVDMPNDDKREILLQHKGGESLVALSELAAEKTAELLPTLFYEQENSPIPNPSPAVKPSKVSEEAAEALTTLLSGSAELKRWIKNWMANQLCNIGTSKLVPVNTFWKFLAGYVEPLTAHIFAKLTGSPPPEDKLSGKLPDAIGIILIRLFTVCSRFFNARGNEIEQRIHDLKSLGKGLKNDEILTNLFSSLSQDLLRLCGLDDPKLYPIPKFLCAPLHKAIIQHAPKLLLRQYLAFSDTSFEDDQLDKRLRSLLFDQRNLFKQEIAIGILTDVHLKQNAYAVDMFNKFYEKLWEISGTERIARTIEAMSGVFAHDAIVSFRNYYGLAEQTALKEATNPAIARFDAWLEAWCKRAIKETIVHMIESSEPKSAAPEGIHPKAASAINIMISLSSIINKNLAGLEESKNLRLTKDAYQKEALHAFGNLAHDLFAFSGFNPFSTLSLPDVPAEKEMKELMWKTVRDAIVPQVLQSFHSETFNWQMQLERSYEEIDNCFHTSHPQWACKVMAQFATDFLKNYLANSNDEASRLMFESLSAYLLTTASAEGPVAAALVNNSQDTIRQVIGENIRTAAFTSNSNFNTLWPTLTTYFEAMIAKFFAEFSLAIHTIETEHPDFIVDTAIQFLKDTAEHFSVITNKMEELGEEHVFNVNMKEVIAAFGTKLHDGVPLDPEAPESDKEMIRLKGCFIPLADKFLKLANLEIDDFPLPSPIRKQIGQIAVEKLLPLCLMKAFQKGIEPQVRDQMILNFVQTLYAALNAIPAQKQTEALPEANVHPNSKQKHLYETCGKLVLELVKIIPDTTVQYVFMKEKVKEMSAEAIGDAMMPHLSRWTVIQIIDTMIYSGLPSLHPSKWEGKLGREVLVPRKAFVRPDGKMELKPVKDFKFDFPSESLENIARQSAAKEEAVMVRTELRDAFTRTISQQLHAKAWAITKSIWNLFQSTIGDFIERRFGERGTAAKAFLDKIFRRIFFDIIGTAVTFLSAPLIALVKYVFEKTVIDKRSEDVIRNLESDIMENLIYKWTDTVFDALLNLKEKKLSPTPT